MKVNTEEEHDMAHRRCTNRDVAAKQAHECGARRRFIKARDEQEGDNLVVRECPAMVSIHQVKQVSAYK